jgi:mercuric ion transport protein
MGSTEPKYSLAAMAGAAVAVAGASVCCVVPLVLVLLGVSGAWIANLTAMDAYRPWFAGLTLVCLGAAFWALYGPNARCRSDGVCVEPRMLRRRRRLLWAVTAGCAALLLFPYYIVLWV